MVCSAQFPWRPGFKCYANYLHQHTRLMHTTSDLGTAAGLSMSASCRVTQIVTYIHTKSPKTQIVLLGILPRGGLYWEKDQAWIWPNRYTAAIAAVNAGYYVSTPS